MEAEGWEAEGPVPADPDKLSPANLHKMMQVGSTEWQCATGQGFPVHKWPLAQTGSVQSAGACIGSTRRPSAMSWLRVQSAGAFQQGTGPCGIGPWWALLATTELAPPPCELHRYNSLQSLLACDSLSEMLTGATMTCRLCRHVTGSWLQRSRVCATSCSPAQQPWGSWRGRCSNSRVRGRSRSS